MNDTDWNRLQPLEVVRGSHGAGSGKGCAMNVVSWINGDQEITDYPKCAAPPLAVMVQQINDALGWYSRPASVAAQCLGDPLSPEDALIAIDLGVQTIGTSGASQAVRYSWSAYMLEKTKHWFDRSVHSIIDEVATELRKPAPALWRFHSRLWLLPKMLEKLVCGDVTEFAELLMDAGVTYEFNLHSVDMDVDFTNQEIDDHFRETAVPFVRDAILTWRELQGLDATVPVDSETLQKTLL